MPRYKLIFMCGDQHDLREQVAQGGYNASGGSLGEQRLYVNQMSVMLDQALSFFRIIADTDFVVGSAEQSCR